MDASVNTTVSVAANRSSSTATYYNTAAGGESCPDNSYLEAQNSASENTETTVAVSAAAIGSSVDWSCMGEATCNCSLKNASVQSLETQEVQVVLQVPTASNTLNSNTHGDSEGASLNVILSDSISESSSSSSLYTPSEYSEPCPGPINYYEIPGMPHVLTPRLMALGDEAILSYETVREEQIAGLPHKPSDPYRPFSPFSRENLERYFNALVDAKGAVTLRKSAIEADIYDCLRMLDVQMGLYCKDQVFLESAAYQVHLIKHESSVRNLGINFPVLEFFRSITQDPAYGPSFLEKNSAVDYSIISQNIQTRGDIRCVVDQFLDNPQSIMEHRLPFSKDLHK